MPVAGLASVGKDHDRCVPAPPASASKNLVIRVVPAVTAATVEEQRDPLLAVIGTIRHDHRNRVPPCTAFDSIEVSVSRPRGCRSSTAAHVQRRPRDDAQGDQDDKQCDCWRTASDRLRLSFHGQRAEPLTTDLRPRVFPRGPFVAGGVPGNGTSDDEVNRRNVTLVELEQIFLPADRTTENPLLPVPAWIDRADGNRAEDLEPSPPAGVSNSTPRGGLSSHGRQEHARRHPGAPTMSSPESIIQAG